MILDWPMKSLGKIWRTFFSRRLFMALLRYRVLAGTEHRYVIDRGLKTIVDIGSNRGQFALAAREFQPDAKIISFEPLSTPAAIYRAVFDGDARAVLHEVAIGPSLETKKMHVAARDDSSSLLEMSATQKENFRDQEEVDLAEVQVSPLDRFVAPEDLVRPAFLKLDVQGFELEALMGCESLIHHFDYIYCECSFVELYIGQKFGAEIIAWLATKGFDLVGLYNLLYDGDGRTLQADCLFIPQVSAS